MKPLNTKSLKARFRYHYSCSFRSGYSLTHSYVVEGSKGAMELRIMQFGNSDCAEFSAGLEMHSATPMYGDNPPDHGQCQAVSMRPCWHDGTSSYAMDKLLPMWKASNANLVDTFQMVVTEYEKRFDNGEKS